MDGILIPLFLLLYQSNIELVSHQIRVRTKKCRKLQRIIHRLAALFFTLISFCGLHRRKRIFQIITFSCECYDMGAMH